MADQSLEGLEWLCGSWCGRESGGENRARWERVSAVVLEGSGERSQSGQVLHRESMRIEQRDAEVIYLFREEGRAEMAFRLVHQHACEALFENTGAGFPHWLRLWRRGDGLHARIESRDGARVMDWAWELE